MRNKAKAEQKAVPLEYGGLERRWHGEEDDGHEKSEEPVQRHHSSDSIGKEGDRGVVRLGDVDHDEAGDDKEDVHAKTACMYKILLVIFYLNYRVAVHHG